MEINTPHANPTAMHLEHTKNTHTHTRTHTHQEASAIDVARILHVGDAAAPIALVQSSYLPRRP